MQVEGSVLNDQQETTDCQEVGGGDASKCSSIDDKLGPSVTNTKEGRETIDSTAVQKHLQLLHSDELEVENIINKENSGIRDSPHSEEVAEILNQASAEAECVGTKSLGEAFSVADTQSSKCSEDKSNTMSQPWEVQDYNVPQGAGQQVKMFDPTQFGAMPQPEVPQRQQNGNPGVQSAPSQDGSHPSSLDNSWNNSLNQWPQDGNQQSVDSNAYYSGQGQQFHDQGSDGQFNSQQPPQHYSVNPQNTWDPNQQNTWNPNMQGYNQYQNQVPVDPNIAGQQWDGYNYQQSHVSPHQPQSQTFNQTENEPYLSGSEQHNQLNYYHGEGQIEPVQQGGATLQRNADVPGGVEYANDGGGMSAFFHNDEGEQGAAGHSGMVQGAVSTVATSCEQAALMTHVPLTGTEPNANLNQTTFSDNTKEPQMMASDSFSKLPHTPSPFDDLAGDSTVETQPSNQGNMLNAPMTHSRQSSFGQNPVKFIIGSEPNSGANSASQSPFPTSRPSPAETPPQSVPQQSPLASQEGAAAQPSVVHGHGPSMAHGHHVDTYSAVGTHDNMQKAPHNVPPEGVAAENVKQIAAVDQHLPSQSLPHPGQSRQEHNPGNWKMNPSQSQGPGIPPPVSGLPGQSNAHPQAFTPSLHGVPHQGVPQGSSPPGQAFPPATLPGVPHQGVPQGSSPPGQAFSPATLPGVPHQGVPQGSSPPQQAFLPPSLPGVPHQGMLQGNSPPQQAFPPGLTGVPNQGMPQGNSPPGLPGHHPYSQQQHAMIPGSFHSPPPPTRTLSLEDDLPSGQASPLTSQVTDGTTPLSSAQSAESSTSKKDFSPASDVLDSPPPPPPTGMGSPGENPFRRPGSTPRSFPKTPTSPHSPRSRHSSASSPFSVPSPARTPCQGKDGGVGAAGQQVTTPEEALPAQSFSIPGSAPRTRTSSGDHELSIYSNPIQAHPGGPFQPPLRSPPADIASNHPAKQFPHIPGAVLSDGQCPPEHSSGVPGSSAIEAAGALNQVPQVDSVSVSGSQHLPGGPSISQQMMTENVPHSPGSHSGVSLSSPQHAPSAPQQSEQQAHRLENNFSPATTLWQNPEPKRTPVHLAPAAAPSPVPVAPLGKPLDVHNIQEHIQEEISHMPLSPTHSIKNYPPQQTLVSKRQNADQQQFVQPVSLNSDQPVASGHQPINLNMKPQQQPQQGRDQNTVAYEKAVPFPPAAPSNQATSHHDISSQAQPSAPCGPRLQQANQAQFAQNSGQIGNIPQHDSRQMQSHPGSDRVDQRSHGGGHTASQLPSGSRDQLPPGGLEYGEAPTQTHMQTPRSHHERIGSQSSSSSLTGEVTFDDSNKQRDSKEVSHTNDHYDNRGDRRQQKSDDNQRSDPKYEDHDHYRNKTDTVRYPNERTEDRTRDNRYDGYRDDRDRPSSRGPHGYNDHRESHDGSNRDRPRSRQGYPDDYYDRPRSRQGYPDERPRSRQGYPDEYNRPNSRQGHPYNYDRPRSRQGYPDEYDRPRSRQGYADDPRYYRPRSRQGTDERSSRPSSRQGQSEGERPRSRAEYDYDHRRRDEYRRSGSDYNRDDYYYRHGHDPRYRDPYDYYGREYYGRQRSSYDQDPYYNDYYNQPDRYARGYYEELRSYQQQQAQQSAYDYQRYGYDRQYSSGSAYDYDRHSQHSHSARSTPALDTGADQFAREFHQGSRPSSRTSGYEHSSIYPNDTRYHSYDQSYGYDQYGYQQPKEEPTPRRMTPVKFTIPHVCASIGPGGELVKVLPHRPADGQPATVEITDPSIAQIDPFQTEVLKSFPGPLVKGDTHKNDVLVHCQKKARQCRENPNLMDRDSAELLWNFLEMLVKQNGTFIGTDISGLLLDKTKSMNPDDGSHGDAHEGAEINALSDSLVSVVDRSAINTTVASDNTDEQKLRRYRDLYTYGQRKEALDFAMKNGLWGHALFMSHYVDAKTRASILTRFGTTAVKMNDPLTTVYQLMSGRQPAAATLVSDERWGDWRPHLSIILANPSEKPDLQRKSIVTTGDTLAARGLLYASHFCYLMAELHLGSYDKKSDKLVLIGSSHSLPFQEFATNEAIQCTEVFEYGKSLANTAHTLYRFQCYKYLYATRLADCGLAEEAFNYCEVLAGTLLLNPGLYSCTLLRQVYELANRLKFHDPRRLTGGEDFEDPEWIDNLRRIALALEEGTIQPLSGTQTPAYGGSTATGSEVGDLTSASQLGDAAWNQQYQTQYGQQPQQQQAQYATEQYASQYGQYHWDATQQQWVLNPNWDQSQMASYNEGSYLAYNQLQQQQQQVPGQGDQQVDGAIGEQYSQYGQQQPQAVAEVQQQPASTTNVVSATSSSTNQPDPATNVNSTSDDASSQSTMSPRGSFDYYGMSSQADSPNPSPPPPAPPPSTPVEGAVYSRPLKGKKGSQSLRKTVHFRNVQSHSYSQGVTQGTAPPQAQAQDQIPPQTQAQAKAFTAEAESDTDSGSETESASGDSEVLSYRATHGVYQGYNSTKKQMHQKQPGSSSPPSSPRSQGSSTPKASPTISPSSTSDEIFKFGVPPPPSSTYRAPVTTAPLGAAGNSSQNTLADLAKSGGISGSHPQKDNDKTFKKPPPKKGGGWFNGIFNKLTAKNEMKLPDDKNPTIVWDEDKKRWINKDGDEEEEKKLNLPPPTDSELTGGAANASMPTLSATPAATPNLKGPTPTPGSNRFSRQKGLGRGARNQYVDVLAGSASKPAPTTPSNLFSVMPKSASVPANIFIPSMISNNASESNNNEQKDQNSEVQHPQQQQVFNPTQHAQYGNQSGMPDQSESTNQTEDGETFSRSSSMSSLSQEVQQFTMPQSSNHSEPPQQASMPPPQMPQMFNPSQFQGGAMHPPHSSGPGRGPRYGQRRAYPK